MAALPRPQGDVKEQARARVLVVDHEPAVRRALARALMRGFEVLTAEDGPSALGLLSTTRVDAVLLDLDGSTSDSALARLRSAHPDVEVVVLAGPEHAAAASAAARADAAGLVFKAADLEEAAALALARAVERRRLRGRVRALERREGEQAPEAELLGGSPRMQELLRRATGVAGGAAPVLITGERGSGKELLARVIHRRSPRADRPFVALSVGALPEALIEEELFGAPHVPGAIEAAGEGTLYLDEIEALPPRAQARLLRAIERGEVDGVAGASPRRLAARILAASAADLRALVAAGAFREDFLARLSVVSLHVPPLRKRRDDIPLLAMLFLRRHGQRDGRAVRRIGAEAMRLLREHTWPGNVRELEHAIEHAAVVARGESVTPGDLPPTVGGGGRRRGVRAAADHADLPYPEARERAIDAFERAYVEALLARTGGNVSEAARQAGMDRANFRRLRRRVEGRSDEGGGDDGEERGRGEGERDGAAG